MTGKLTLLIFHVAFITEYAHGDYLKNAIIGREEGSNYSEFPITTLTFDTEIIGLPKDFYLTNRDYINRVNFPKIGNITISLLNLDVVSRFTYKHIPARTTFDNVLVVESIKELELVLGRAFYRSATQAEWGFFSYDSKGSYIFEFYVASFNKDSHEITGIRYGVALWSSQNDEE